MVGDDERPGVPVEARVGDRQDVELMYEFYTDLRDEINQSIDFQNQIVIGGGVLIGVAYGLQFSGVLQQIATQNPTLKLIIAALPTITLFTIALWIVEQSRMMRAGHYLHFLENKINAELDGVYLTWENWLRSGNTPVHHRTHHAGQLIGYALFLYGLACLGLGVYAVDILGVTLASIRTLSFDWRSLSFVYFLLNVVLLLYLAQYTYLIIFHGDGGRATLKRLAFPWTHEESSFEEFKRWEIEYARDRVSGFAYQSEVKDALDETGDGPVDGDDR
jgi:hypothetical protein